MVRRRAGRQGARLPWPPEFAKLSNGLGEICVAWPLWRLRACVIPGSAAALPLGCHQSFVSQVRYGRHKSTQATVGGLCTVWLLAGLIGWQVLAEGMYWWRDSWWILKCHRREKIKLASWILWHRLPLQSSRTAPCHWWAGTVLTGTQIFTTSLGHLHNNLGHQSWCRIPFDAVRYLWTTVFKNLGQT
jgi:hypothetical protein